MVRLEDDRVTFTYKDYAQGGRVREMPLSADEFLRRFLLHVLPDRFVRIRYYEFLANRCREPQLALCRKLLKQEPPTAASPRESWSELVQRLTGRDPTLCPQCNQGHLTSLLLVPSERPPPNPGRKLS